MDWTAWILLSACFLAFYDLAKKASVRENAVLPVLLCSTSFGCAAFFVGLSAAGRLGAVLGALDRSVVGFGLLKSCVVAVSWIFTFCGLRTLPITIATPIRSSAPALVFLGAVLFYAEMPSLVQGLGMLAVFAGYWTFSWAGRHEGIDFFRNRAVWCAIAGMMFSAASALIDKYIFQVVKAPVEPTQLVFQAGLILVYAVCLLATRLLALLVPGSTVRVRGFPFAWRWTIPLVGLFLTCADWLYFHGLAIPEVPISVAALLRRFSVVITFALGAFFFRERNLRRKAIALALVLLGIALLCRG